MITIQKLIRNGWETDEPVSEIEESLLEKTDGFIDNENEYTTWSEWKLEGKIVKRSAHVRLKKSILLEGIASMLK